MPGVISPFVSNAHSSTAAVVCSMVVDCVSVSTKHCQLPYLFQASGELDWATYL